MQLFKGEVAVQYCSLSSPLSCELPEMRKMSPIHLYIIRTWPSQCLYLIVTYMPNIQVISAATTRGTVPWENRVTPVVSLWQRSFHKVTLSPLLEEGMDYYLLILLGTLFPLLLLCTIRISLPDPSIKSTELT